MSERHTIIDGETFADERGTLRFFNLLNMQEIVRFYEIAPVNESIIRAWQGHEKEKKWFYCLSGSFIINLVKIDNFDNPPDRLMPKRVLLSEKKPKVLQIPNGFATGIKANGEGCRLQVFSNFDLEESKMDDYRFPLEKWKADWKP